MGIYDQEAPYDFVKEYEPQSGSTVFRIRILREPDPEWEVTVGEIAYQIRSALDHLVTQLVVLNGGDAERHKGSFPIFSNSDQYWKKRIKVGNAKMCRRDILLKGMRKEHRTMVDALQPYKRGQFARYDPLTVLNDLCNGDKHRDAHPTLLVVRDSRFMVENNPFTIVQPHKRMEGPLTIRKPLHDGAEIIRFRPNNWETAPREMNVKGMVTIGVCFGTRQVFVWDLQRILDYVEADVIARFSPLFV